MTLTELCAWVGDVPRSMPQDMTAMAESICETFHHTAARLMDMGFGYLTLDRAASTLSMGERQRMQLARAVRNRTTGVLYVLDEPSIGLHPSNIDGLLHVMQKLRTDGNSINPVDHDVQILGTADHFIELGPEAWVGGGTIIAEENRAAIKQHPNSRIGGFLAGRDAVRVHTPVDVSEIFAHGKIELKTEQIHTVKPLHAVFPQGGCLW